MFISYSTLIIHLLDGYFKRATIAMQIRYVHIYFRISLFQLSLSGRFLSKDWKGNKVRSRKKALIAQAGSCAGKTPFGGVASYNVCERSNK